MRTPKCLTLALPTELQRMTTSMLRRTATSIKILRIAAEAIIAPRQTTPEMLQMETGHRATVLKRDEASVVLDVALDVALQKTLMTVRNASAVEIADQVALPVLVAVQLAEKGAAESVVEIAVRMDLTLRFMSLASPDRQDGKTSKLTSPAAETTSSTLS